MAMNERLVAAAERVATAYTTGPCAPLGELVTTVAEAYEVQEINTRRWLDAGRRLVGRKIGLTSAAVQQQMGVAQPDYGMLFVDMAVDEGAEVDTSRLLQPKAEAEIAFVVGRDLPYPDTTVAEMISAIEFALPAIEIVDSRIADWKIAITDTVADNASSGLYVLGSRPVALGAFDPMECQMVMTRDGVEVSRGVGRACLGSPVSSAAWLARTMAAAGRPLQAGDTVLTGALGPMVAAAAGEQFDVHIDGLGTVRARFGAAR